MKTIRPLLILSISALTAACSVRTGSSELDKAIAEKAKYDSQVELQVANLRKMIAEFGGGYGPEY